MAKVHPRSVIEPGARIGKNVIIGPFCYIAGNVVIKDNVKLVSHVTILNNTTLGEESIVYPNAVLGREPIVQNKRSFNAGVYLSIGNNCIIGEGVTIHAAEAGTFVGNNTTFMPNSHVGHDCKIGNHVIVTNNVMIGGHCQIEDYVNLGGGSAIHQWCKIGQYSMIAGMTGIAKDVPPFMMAASTGSRIGKLRGLNIEGLKRGGFSKEDIDLIENAYKAIFLDKSTPIEDALDLLRDDNIHILRLKAFIKEALKSKRGLTIQ